QPVVHVGFDLLASSLPLDVAWPVLISNAVDWLTGTAATAPTPVGAPLPLTAPAGAQGVEVTAPDGHVQRLDVADPPPHADQVGVWQARWQGVDADPTLFAVHAAAAESDLVATRPRADAATPGTGTARGLRVFGPGIAA